ncbi:hypothetical protein Bbelb_134750 [Branchiostoma belcheri]|nr:hypothetical protein Bbelb_134750 [Branchiostoma belcheri]
MPQGFDRHNRSLLAMYRLVAVCTVNDKPPTQHTDGKISAPPVATVFSRGHGGYEAPTSDCNWYYNTSDLRDRLHKRTTNIYDDYDVLAVPYVLDPVCSIVSCVLGRHRRSDNQFPPPSMFFRGAVGLSRQSDIVSFKAKGGSAPHEIYRIQDHKDMI